MISTTAKEACATFDHIVVKNSARRMGINYVGLFFLIFCMTTATLDIDVLIGLHFTEILHIVYIYRDISKIIHE